MFAKFRDKTTESESTANSRLVIGLGDKQPWQFPKLALSVGLPLFLGALLLAVPFAADRLETDSNESSTESATPEPATPEPATPEPATPESSVPAAPQTSVLGQELDQDPEVLEPEPVEVQATFDGERVTISGSVIDEAQRLGVVNAIEAALVAVEVDDQLDVSGGEAAVPGADERLAGLAATIESLVGVPRWSATLDDDTLSLTLEGLLDGPTVDPAESGSPAIDLDAIFSLSEAITAFETTIEIVASAAPGGDPVPDTSANETETS